MNAAEMLQECCISWPYPELADNKIFIVSQLWGQRWLTITFSLEGMGLKIIGEALGLKSFGPQETNCAGKSFGSQ